MRYKHDCERCKYLGEFCETYHGREAVFDLYYCSQDRAWPTVIARYGDEGPEYITGMSLAEHPAFPQLAEAKRLAVEAGYIPNPSTA